MTGCSYPPTYDGIDVDEYIEWEIAIDNIFANHFMCPRRKVNNAASVFMTFCFNLVGELKSIR